MGGSSSPTSIRTSSASSWPEFFRELHLRAASCGASRRWSPKSDQVRLPELVGCASPGHPGPGRSAASASRAARTLRCAASSGGSCTRKAKPVVTT